MKKIFIDCGFHHGEGLTQFIEMLGIDHNWHIHAFEPNPECHALERINIMGFKNGVRFNIYPSAVWTHAGTVQFSQENWEISKSGSPKNPCVLDGWGSCITKINKAWPGLAPPIEVPCIDFSEFVKQEHAFTPIDSQIYCKMDIEGAEFAVLRKMLKDGSINCIKKLWVEFHERYIPGENRQTKAALIRELSLYTEVEEWH
jgi:FkbM family methyltransferase